MSKRNQYSLLAAMTLVVVSGLAFRMARHGSPSIPVTFVTTGGEGEALFRLALRRGYFVDEGLVIKTIPAPLAALTPLRTGLASYALVSERAFVKDHFTGQDLRILSSIACRTGNIKVIARRDHGIFVPRDLKGKRIGVSRRNVKEAYLASFLVQFGLSLGDVKLVDSTPENLIDQLQTGRLDALSLTEPQAAALPKGLEENTITFSENSLFSDHELLVAPATFKGDTALAILRALHRAESLVVEQPAQAIQDLASEWAVDSASLRALWGEYEFALRLDQSLLVSLEDRARTLQEAKEAPPGTIPNFLSAFALGPLGTVHPTAVKIIH